MTQAVHSYIEPCTGYITNDCVVRTKITSQGTAGLAGIRARYVVYTEVHCGTRQYRSYIRSLHRSALSNDHRTRQTVCGAYSDIRGQTKSQILYRSMHLNLCLLTSDIAQGFTALQRDHFSSLFHVDTVLVLSLMCIGSIGCQTEIYIFTFTMYVHVQIIFDSHGSHHNFRNSIVKVQKNICLGRGIIKCYILYPFWGTSSHKNIECEKSYHYVHL